MASPSSSPSIRPATAADGPAVRRLVNDARLNPRDLDPRRFLVADVAGVIVACAQVRVHGRGTRELASVAVAPEHRGSGLGRAISEATIAREPVRPLYLYAESRNVPFWERFGFGMIDGEDVPKDLRGSLRVARVATAVYSVLVRRRMRIEVMRRSEV